MVGKICEFLQESLQYLCGSLQHSVFCECDRYQSLPGLANFVRFGIHCTKMSHSEEHGNNKFCVQSQTWYDQSSQHDRSWHILASKWFRCFKNWELTTIEGWPIAHSYILKHVTWNIVHSMLRTYEDVQYCQVSKQQYFIKERNVQHSLK